MGSGDSIRISKGDVWEEDTSQRERITKEILNTLGTGYRVVPGKLVRRGDYGGDALTRTADVLREGLRNSSSRLLGARRIVRLCEEPLPTILTGCSTDTTTITTLEDLSGSNFVEHKRSPLPATITGYIANRRTPTTIVDLLESNLIPQKRKADYTS